jgi:hypothetical protein
LENIQKVGLVILMAGLVIISICLGVVIEISTWPMGFGSSTTSWALLSVTFWLIIGIILMIIGIVCLVLKTWRKKK